MISELMNKSVTEATVGRECREVTGLIETLYGKAFGLGIGLNLDCKPVKESCWDWMGRSSEFWNLSDGGMRRQTSWYRNSHKCGSDMSALPRVLEYRASVLVRIGASA